MQKKYYSRGEKPGHQDIHQHSPDTAMSMSHLSPLRTLGNERSRGADPAYTTGPSPSLSGREAGVYMPPYSASVLIILSGLQAATSSRSGFHTQQMLCLFITKYTRQTFPFPMTGINDLPEDQTPSSSPPILCLCLVVSCVLFCLVVLLEGTIQWPLPFAVGSDQSTQDLHHRNSSNFYHRTYNKTFSLASNLSPWSMI